MPWAPISPPQRQHFKPEHRVTWFRAGGSLGDAVACGLQALCRGEGFLQVEAHRAHHAVSEKTVVPGQVQLGNQEHNCGSRSH